MLFLSQLYSKYFMKNFFLASIQYLSFQFDLYEQFLSIVWINREVFVAMIKHSNLYNLSFYLKKKWLQIYWSIRLNSKFLKKIIRWSIQYGLKNFLYSRWKKEKSFFILLFLYYLIIIWLLKLTRYHISNLPFHFLVHILSFLLKKICYNFVGWLLIDLT